MSDCYSLNYIKVEKDQVFVEMIGFRSSGLSNSIFINCSLDCLDSNEKTANPFNSPKLLTTTNYTSLEINSFLFPQPHKLKCWTIFGFGLSNAPPLYITAQQNSGFTSHLPIHNHISFRLFQLKNRSVTHRRGNYSFGYYVSFICERSGYETCLLLTKNL